MIRKILKRVRDLIEEIENYTEVKIIHCIGIEGEQRSFG